MKPNNAADRFGPMICRLPLLEWQNHSGVTENSLKRRLLNGLACGLIALVPAPLFAQSLVTTSTNTYGTPGGLIDMPTAEVAPDAELSTTIAHFGGTTRTTLTFQITPRLSGSFRYSALKGLQIPVRGQIYPTYYDRSFDLSYQVLREGQYNPAVKVGLRDMIGTGLYGAEYITATKGFMDGRLRVTGGLGWGRLGSFNSFSSTGTRPTALLGTGGVPTYDRWFRGPVAAFGGISYQATDKLKFMVEYSSDAYPDETVTSNMFQRKSPWNVGLTYDFNRSTSLSAYYMYGSELGVALKFALNPRSSGPGSVEQAPLPVAVRRASAADLGWASDPAKQQTAANGLSTLLASQGVEAEAVRLTGSTAQVVVRNETYGNTPQLVGRTARAMTRTLPASVETFVVTQTYKGVPVSSVRLKRSDIEALENSDANAILARAEFTDGLENRALYQGNQAGYPRLDWSFGPYAKLGVFDPVNPARLDLGLKLDASYNFAPGWVAEGSVSSRLVGNLSNINTLPPNFASPNPPPVVRSDFKQYNQGHRPGIDYLTLAKYGRPGSNLYSRVTMGYLEPMYAGVSGELLWKPVDSRLALGVEANYVAKRDYDRLFGVQNYDVLTGHVSAYYDFGNGFHGQLDVGRYLAGDYGATVSLDREFANGWRVGAYATKTNVSAQNFGEGSFDKGIRITIPLDWATGQSSTRKQNIEIQSLTRDGGARLNVNGRLYDRIRETHQPDMAKSWGKFWR